MDALRRIAGPSPARKNTVDAVNILCSSDTSMRREPTPSGQDVTAFACSSSSILDILVGFVISKVSRPRSIEGVLLLDCLPVGSLFLRKTTDSVNLIETEFFVAMDLRDIV